ncbi:Dyp-type peroxidase, partial [Micromonospora chalcea]
RIGSAVEPFHGARQSGVTTEPQAHAAFVAFTLRPGTDRAALGRMLRLLSDDAARLTQGRPALADTEPELGLLPARLTVTFGFGPGLYAAAGLDDRRPTSVADLPAFRIDRLQPRWSGGDLLLQICADDPLTVAHAQRVLTKDSRPFATVRWVQQGFRRAAGAEPGRTQRNLFGQLDGTANPKPGVSADTAVWVTDGPDWLRDSTTLVVRRISMNLETWDLLGRADRELSVGRRLDTGAPLTGRAEHDEPDFAALGPDGLTVIPDFSHLTRARVTDDRQKILRRPYNYDGVPTAEGHADSGLVFAAYQADIARQFLPIQRRLAERDLLNEWTTPIGSAVFAVPPGCPEGGWIGQQVLG